ncbi:Holliday junction ATP-dependent DNA helicase RuvB [Acrasis kona]|uniref:Holliday junction ATP-dependent DNA helicase RuvB n=1 Tax=Acrasis kona TaxID=1008807 RepID=A0AAW2ZNV7_9EUKA
MTEDLFDIFDTVDISDTLNNVLQSNSTFTTNSSSSTENAFLRINNVDVRPSDASKNHGSHKRRHSFSTFSDSKRRKTEELPKRSQSSPPDNSLNNSEDDNTPPESHVDEFLSKEDFDEMMSGSINATHVVRDIHNVGFTPIQEPVSFMERTTVGSVVEFHSPQNVPIQNILTIPPNIQPPQIVIPQPLLYNRNIKRTRSASIESLSPNNLSEPTRSPPHLSPSSPRYLVASNNLRNRLKHSEVRPQRPEDKYMMKFSMKK